MLHTCLYGYGIRNTSKKESELLSGRRHVCLWLSYVGYRSKIYGAAQSVRSFIKQSGFNSTEADDSTLTLLEYNRGTSIVAASCVDANGYGRRQIVISGSKGTIEIKPLENPTKMTYAERDGKDEYKDKASYIDLSGYNFDRRYYYMITDFAYMIQRRFDKMIFQMDYEYEKKLHVLLMQAINL